MGHIFMAEQGSHVVREITDINHDVITVAGSGAAGFADGVGTAAMFNAPMAVACSPNTTYHGDTEIYVGDGSNARVRRIHRGTAQFNPLRIRRKPKPQTCGDVQRNALATGRL